MGAPVVTLPIPSTGSRPLPPPPHALTNAVSNSAPHHGAFIDLFFSKTAGLTQLCIFKWPSIAVIGVQTEARPWKMSTRNYDAPFQRIYLICLD